MDKFQRLGLVKLSDVMIDVVDVIILFHAFNHLVDFFFLLFCKLHGSGGKSLEVRTGNFDVFVLQGLYKLYDFHHK